MFEIFFSSGLEFLLPFSVLRWQAKSAIDALKEVEVQTTVLASTCRFGEQLLAGYEAMVDANSKKFTCDSSVAPRSYGSLVLMQSESWSSQEDSPTVDRTLVDRVLPGTSVLGVLPALTLFLHRKYEQVMILTNLRARGPVCAPAPHDSLAGTGCRRLQPVSPGGHVA